MAQPHLPPHTPASQQPPLTPRPKLVNATSQLAFVVVKARAFDAEVPTSGDEDGSDMIDDRAVAALESGPDNPTEAELAAALGDLNVDQLEEVVALVLVGRGDFAADEWSQALAQSRDVAARRGVTYLLETPLLGDLIEEGLDALGYNITDQEML